MGGYLTRARASVTIDVVDEDETAESYAEALAEASAAAGGARIDAALLDEEWVDWLVVAERGEVRLVSFAWKTEEGYALGMLRRTVSIDDTAAQEDLGDFMVDIEEDGAGGFEAYLPHMVDSTGHARDIAKVVAGLRSEQYTVQHVMVAHYDGRRSCITFDEAEASVAPLRCVPSSGKADDVTRFFELNGVEDGDDDGEEEDEDLWPSDWEVVEMPVDDARRIVSVDLGAQYAPFDELPIRIDVRIPMLRPRPDGMRSAEEAEALFALEDRLCEAFDEFGIVEIARVLHRGVTQLVFVASDRPDVLALRTACGDTAPYALEIAVADDPGWTLFFDELLPDEYVIQEIMNDRLLEMRVKEHEDRLEAVRLIDHAATFPSMEAADQAARVLGGRGFQVDAPQAPSEDGDECWLEFHREDRLDDGRPNEITREILDVILPLGGEYDGWGAPIVR